MDFNPQLIKLEDRIRELINSITKLHNENQRIRDELALTRQDFEAQASKLDEAKIQIKTLSDAPSIHQDEQVNKLQFQDQQIQLLERERLNLRDQIAFLQNTMQSKEKDWQDKLNTQQDTQTQLQETNQTRITQLQTQLQEAQDSITQLNQELDDAKQQTQQQTNHLQEQNKHLSEQLTDKQQQLSNLQQRITENDNEADKWQEALQMAKDEFAQKEQELIESAHLKQEQLNTRLAQESERFRSEFALQAQQHEQNLANINLLLSQQKERAQNDKAELQEQIFQLNRQNQEYRSLLLQSANDIRTLLARLPVDIPQRDINQNGETK